MNHPDRLFPADPATRDVARRLYAEVQAAPILSPHGHVDARMLAADDPFSDPAALLITPDHYVTRLLHAIGVPLERLRPPTPPREIWNELFSRWHLFAGTPVRLWMESQFALTLTTTDIPVLDAYDAVAERLATDEFRPRALFKRFGIRVLATTDDPADDLAAHRQLHADGLGIIPTFRADRYLNPALPAWTTALDELSAASTIDCGSYAGLLEALRARRHYFLDNGATSTDSGVPDAWAEPLEDADAERIHAAGRAGAVSDADATAYRRNLLYRFAEMSTEDGLVMQLHPSVIRNHHAPTLASYGPDTGHDLPDIASFTRPLQRLLNDFGTHPNLHLVLFTVDETAFSREIGPLAGFYPTVFAGAPWWFLDSPAGIARYKRAITDSAGFYKTSGFIDDTRAFCSIPARHDMSRRADASFLAGLVTTHQLDEEEATTIARDLVTTIPSRAFKL